MPDSWIDEIFAVMALCPQHTFQILTKRPERMRKYLSPRDAEGFPWAVIDAARDMGLPFPDIAHNPSLHNVWLGTSIEDQVTAETRMPYLRGTEAAIRFLSIEPLLGPILGLDLSGIDWVIVGGESGPKARPMHPDWARSLRDQCAAAGVAFLFKQWGEWAPVCALEDQQIDSLYHPAPKSHPDASRRCKVAHHVLHADGSQHGITERMAFLAGTGAMTVFATGKKRSGRKLDGIEHNAYPPRVA